MPLPISAPVFVAVLCHCLVVMEEQMDHLPKVKKPKLHCAMSHKALTESTRVPEDSDVEVCSDGSNVSKKTSTGSKRSKARSEKRHGV